MTIITLKAHKEESLKRFHPWVFSGAIARMSEEPEEGELVKVVSRDGETLGYGHYQIGSIAVRMLTFEDEVVDRQFFKGRLEAAYQMRKSLGLACGQRSNCYRLAHGEGDSLPGVVIDVYGNTAVLQAHSVGMHVVREVMAELIVEVVPDVRKVFYKSEGTLPYKAPITVKDGYLIGAFEEGDDLAVENGLKFRADWLKGQKTGFFLDQRENRLLLQHYAKGRDVLNMFCYTGGFSLYALRGDARMVHSVDASERAVELVNGNVAMNFADDKRHEAFAADAFDFLTQIEGRYDLIVLDPPAFAKHRDAVRNALIGYRRINTMAFKAIRSGGVLFTFSCSQAVSPEQFRLAVFTAAAQSGRCVRILHKLTQPVDHPINIYHPEGEYLKGLVLYVE
ncbi:MAG: class I SAM-dependent rRNA methyltransferase [Paludibacteraceae bacterium]|nr:class I SAM-dependent rRNA methyltransferase [Paludibacteraceae bacterium]